jgi:hypothetical protein
MLNRAVSAAVGCRDGAGPGGVPQGGGQGIDAVEHELGEEGVEVVEVPVQHTTVGACQR